MNKEIIVSTNCSVLQPFLNGDLPNGVKINSPPPKENRMHDSLSMTVNFDIQLTVDFTKITAYALAAWLVSRSKKMKGNHVIKINRKEIPADDPKAIELVTNEVENKQSE